MKRIPLIKKSIKWRYTCIFICLIALVLTTVLLANTFLLERYYTREKITTLEHAYETLNNMIKLSADTEAGASKLFPSNYDTSNPDTETPATTYLKQLSETYNVNVIVMDTKTDTIFSTFGDLNFQSRKLNQYIFGNRNYTTRQMVRSFDNYTIEKNVDDISKNTYLESWGYFSDNTTCFIMSMPVSSVKESVSFFNRFLLFIGVFAMLGGSVIVYFMSREITKPINQLARLSEKISAQDFSARYNGDSLDEIGVLGNSMNTLSERLQKSIADLKTANNELQSDIENKTRYAERQKEFVANVSHELKTPIALIQGYAEGLNEGLADDPESRAYYCGVIVDEAQRMNKLVHALMNLSSIEQGKDLPDFALFDISKVVNGVISKSDILIKQQDAHVEVDIPEGTMVWADEFKVEQIITNYLNNALHHLEAPNNISIFSEREPDGIISIHVSNTGKPIPEEDLEKIWEKFFKVDKAHTRSYGGSGLGLSIVKAIVSAHHQKCGAKNTRTGVDFWFTLEREEKKR
ncbi:sensor histidine kinase [Oribacterium sp. WCC10]|uniref:sensor histidine kinase n=1 Tax=Oribacterium sp. WCC10 TaxID=1855343 RepID=UPI0008EF01CD|nr:HAMP domain-containing sensor histidine kinase [Oribacterium sp. WCC10]SFG51770.1 Signal transduction histidine kinase [Oribacterium sp. WCC10]